MIVVDESLQAILELTNGFLNGLWGLVGHKVGASQVEFRVVVIVSVSWERVPVIRVLVLFSFQFKASDSVSDTDVIGQSLNVGRECWFWKGFL